VLAIYGYRMLHGVVGAMAVVGGVMFAFLSVQLVRNNDVGAALTWGHFSVGPFLLAMSVAATWQLTFAPYVADYSRYLPANTKISSSFWTTYAGTVLASSWMFAFGAIAVAVAGNAFNGGSIEFIVRQGAFAPGLFFLLLIVGNTGGNAFNVYGLFMSATTTVSAFRPFRVTVTVRTLIITAGAAIGTGVAIAGRGNFIGNFTNFIVLLTYFLIPWTSINLVDFYLVRKERYNLAAIFDPRGQYGGADWRTLLAFGIGIVVELPFVSSSFYTGPLVRDVGGADISWILGIIVSGGAYYLLMRRFPVRRGVDARSVTGEHVPAPREAPDSAVRPSVPDR
jgi:nucleobase:cation symporter-1, NCS1 family